MRRGVLRSKAWDWKSGTPPAADNLALGRTVIADCVHPWPLTRDARQQVGSIVMFESPRLTRTASAVSRLYSMRNARIGSRALCRDERRDQRRRDE